MTLPKRKPKVEKRETRWKSPAYLSWIRGFVCAACHSDIKIEAAHVRLGSHTGMGQKPSDYRAVPLCGAGRGGGRGCHQAQHEMGEASFWKAVKLDPEALIAELIKASPKRREIEQIMRERENA